MPERESISSRSASLTERLANRIRREGPIPFNQWMNAALYDQAGYYNRPDLQRWGRQGDYRTSPETSELFAATFAVYFGRLFDELGQPFEWTIVECGAGDGSFAEVVLNIFKNRFPKIFAATRYVIDELSADAAARCKQRLSSFGRHVEFSQLASLKTLSSGIVFSNELVDAFPVHRLTRRNNELLELYVTLTKDERFEWSTGPLSTNRLNDFLAGNQIEIGEGQIIEVSLEVTSWLEAVASTLQNGYLITVDYGEEAATLYGPERPKGSLRAFSRHRFVEVLEQPGEYDITSTVNWTQVQDVGTRLGLETVALERLDRFLIDTGLLSELERRLGEEKSDARKLDLSTRAREMILPGGMASSFQVLIQKRSVRGGND